MTDQGDISELFIFSLKELAETKEPDAIRNAASKFFSTGLNLRQERIWWEKIIRKMLTENFTQADFILFEPIFLRLRLKGCRFKFPCFDFEINTLSTIFLAPWLNPEQKVSRNVPSVLSDITDNRLLMLNLLGTRPEFPVCLTIMKLIENNHNSEFFVRCIFDTAHSSFEHKLLITRAGFLGLQDAPAWVLEHVKRKY